MCLRGCASVLDFCQFPFQLLGPTCIHFKFYLLNELPYFHCSKHTNLGGHLGQTHSSQIGVSLVSGMQYVVSG